MYEMYCLPLRDRRRRRRAGARRAEALRAERRAGRCARHRAGGRRRRAAVSADEGTRQAGGLLRRAVPHHRLHAQQLHQLRACATSSSRCSTSRSRSAATSAWAGASSPTSSASSSRSCSPQKRVGEHWYLGTADAVYQNLYSILREEPRHLIVLSGDHVYKMDYAKMLRFHRERGAGATLAAIEVPSEEAQPLRRPRRSTARIG